MNTVTMKNKAHLAFEVSLALKGFYAVLEIIGGSVLLFVTRAHIVTTVLFFTKEELNEDPKDIIAHYFITVSDTLSISSQHFIAIYLVSHGIIKLFLVVCLFKKKMWSYPISIVVFVIFIMYQLYKFGITNSNWVLLLTVFDIVIVYLTVQEYRYIRKGV